MKRFMSLIALVVMLGVNILTPVSYAQKEYVKSENVGEGREDLEEKVEDFPSIIVTLIEDVNKPEETKIVVIDKWFDYMSYSRRQVQDWIEFADWYDNANFQWEPFDYNNITENVTLYAKWTKKIAYQDWAIKISDGKKSILIKDVNKWWNSSDVDKYVRVMKLKNDEDYCHYEEQHVSEDRYVIRNLVCTQDFYDEVSGILWINVDTYEKIEDYFNSIYGRYYFWWNNWYAEYKDLIPIQNWSYEVTVAQDAQDRWFLNYSKIVQPDFWWRENEISMSPCDVTKWEYLPTPDDWADLMYMWADINGRSVEEQHSGWEVNPGSQVRGMSENNGFLHIEDSLLFQWDFLIPEAWYVWQSHSSSKSSKLMYSRSPSLLWTSMSNEWKVWVFDINDWSLLSRDNEIFIPSEDAYPVRCFVVENPVTVEFNTNGWSNIDSYKVAGWKTITAPANPTKNWYTFDWWYKDREFTKKWNFDEDRVEWTKLTLYAKWKVCGDWFMVKNNICIPNGVDWVIGVSDWTNTIFIKDKNVWAESKCSSELYQLMELYEQRCEDIPQMVDEKWGNRWLDWFCLSNEDFFTQVSNIVGNVDIDTIDEFNDYLNTSMKRCGWKYYFWWNNTGVDYSGLGISNLLEDGSVTNVNQLIAYWFDWWRMWSDEWSGWEQWNTNNPCDWSWEYLPAPEDWTALMTIWGNANGYEILHWKGEQEQAFSLDEEEIVAKWIVYEDTPALKVGGWFMEFSDIGVMDEFLRDMLIPYAWRVLHSCESEPLRGEKNWCAENMYYDHSLRWLWASQDNNGYVWIIANKGVEYGTVENLLLKRPLNDIAIPVRCFVNVPKVLAITLFSEGKVDSEINVVKWEVIEQPVASAKSNAVFQWWYTKKGEKYDFNDPIMEDLELYARWTENEWNGYSWWWSGKWSNSGGSDVSDRENNTKNSDTVGTKWDSNNSSLSSLEGSHGSSDNVSEQTVNTKNSVSSNWNNLTQEFREAYSYSKQNWITTKSSIEEAKMYSPLTRIQMAKMLSNYAVNVLWMEPDISKWIVRFNDVSNKMDRQYDNAVTLSYQLWIMWQNMPNNNFRPNDIVTRAEFVAAFSRMLYWTSDGKYVSTSKYYTYHMQKLEKEWIITNTNPSMKERRWYVMVMLMRSANK